jgi:hypothetical protein
VRTIASRPGRVRADAERSLSSSAASTFAAARWLDTALDATVISLLGKRP